MIASKGSPDSSEFYGQHIVPLGAVAWVTHYQLYPAGHPGDSLYEQTLARGGPLRPDESNPAYRAMAGRACDLGTPFRSLHVLPSVGLLRQSTREVAAVEDIARLAVAVGEEVRVTSFDIQARRLGETLAGNSFAEGYLSGIEEGIPRNSFWGVWRASSEAGLALRALRFMSYRSEGGLDVTYYTPAESDPQDNELLAYVQFWEDVYLNHARPISPEW